ncbi:Holliday junction resolvase RuvX [Thermostichus vulcanus]|uniref:Holliday junction resolvase RuvX n=1 Tax=Thermostichus vulcanus str. 'Rupite' TaxID=2813851 RepID=A0ABT0CCA6_THEVL|nr:Holliday junction resolvase RuvX [Thermostichus vulcanus]MCJ2543405.1 Holliday junction resolvase RuvX [Thermostichus vulcanus str. 'Rupite']
MSHSNPSGLSQAPVVIGFDPGRDKCGVAVVQVQSQLQVLHREVIASSAALPKLQTLWQRFRAEKVILGNQTTAQTWKQQLESIIPPHQIILVDERHSSQEARQRYWDFYPPQGWERLLPKGLRVPANAYDDLVALILVERYCRGASEG